MTLKKALFPTLLLATVLTASCAVNPETDSNFSEDRVMKAWIHTYYPDAPLVGDTGVYLLEMENGTGVPVTDSAYFLTHYTKSDLDGTISATTDVNIAGQSGMYTATNWYGGNYWRVDQGYLPEGLEKAVKGMRAGGRLKLAIPASASSHENSLYTPFTATSENTNQLIDLTIDTVVTDIYNYQELSMKKWFIQHYQVGDTAAEHFYFKKLEEHTSEADTIAEGAAVKVRYIGRMMNGKVFDTNIEDTAKFYRIWKDGSTYNALSIHYYKEDETQFANHNSVVEGFGKAVLKMNYDEKAVTLFGSQLGYGDSGSYPSIPEYCPLIFWLWIEEK